jgi:diguanylate cyclase (GGDEF)-like protein
VLDEERHLRTVIDPLTKVLNRRALMTQLGRLRPPAALLLIDIDWMKRINDTYGFLGGDTTLRVTSARLRSCVTWPACVARIGGEEFVVVTPEDRGVAVALAERIRVACEPAIAFEEFQLVATVSIGVAMLSGTALGALRDADEALIRAKTAGRNRVVS